ncbi:PfkB family carbohydrate kinase [Poseidonibacter sp.]|uniref:PfkB family carbohydrate kinase n=1 Tax=Poseidonibacter sp. TaxID=2321188 RepID=UPI003C77F7D0
MKKVFVNGDFNILHPGHLRLLKFAKESGDYLVVGLNNDKINTKGVREQIRLESIQATSYVDEAFILNTPVLDYINEHQPDIVVKGKEHELKENPELEIINSYGGKLLFSSGMIGFSSIDLLKDEYLRVNTKIEHNNNYLKRHNINLTKLKNILEKFKELNVLVIGDTIVDEYITCEPLGMSQEDPTIVVSPLLTDKFIGGAAIVAGHARTLGANVKFISVLGDDANYNYVESGLKNLNINVSLFKDTTRPTTLKQRFRARDKTLLRVNHLKQHGISSDIQELIIKDILKDIDNINLIIFSDFSYGVLTNKLIDKITLIGKEKKIFMSADSQSSSQVGDISKFKDMTLVTPTEREIRLSLNDFESGLIIISDSLIKKTDTKYIFTTLGAEGVMIYNTNRDELLTDNVQALATNVKDVSGAGDSLLTCSSMALCVGATVWESGYLGSIASAIQVSRMGNIPISKADILKELS